MRIHRMMDLWQLAERMGDCATESDALAMRSLILADQESYGWNDTDDIEDVDWFRMLDIVCTADHPIGAIVAYSANPARLARIVANDGYMLTLATLGTHSRRIQRPSARCWVVLDRMPD